MDIKTVRSLPFFALIDPCPFSVPIRKYSDVHYLCHHSHYEHSEAGIESVEFGAA
jgi:hypothetical protein